MARWRCIKNFYMIKDNKQVFTKGKIYQEIQMRSKYDGKTDLFFIDDQNVTHVMILEKDIPTYFEEIKEKTNFPNNQITSEQLKREGGEWLGATREWIQQNCRNGSNVTWDSNDILKMIPTVEIIEDLAAHVAAAMFNDIVKKLQS